MIYSEKIQKSIRFAWKVHKGQFRKGKDEPYIVHLLTVSLILSKVTKDEDIIIAGILHDTIEDCEPRGSMTKELLEKEFGVEVAKIVDDLTEQDKSLPWAERKRLALEHASQMDKKSLLVKSADVLHNMTDQIADYKKEGDAMFEKFNAGKQMQLERYEKLIAAINKTYPKNPLKSDLEDNLMILKNLWR